MSSRYHVGYILVSVSFLSYVINTEQTRKLWPLFIFFLPRFLVRVTDCYVFDFANCISVAVWRTARHRLSCGAQERHVGWSEACKKKADSNVYKLQLNNVWYTILFIDHVNKANPLWIPFISSIVFKWQLTKKHVIIRVVTSMWKEKILETYYISFSLHSFDAFNFAVSWLQERRVWTHMNLLRAKLTLELRCALSAIKVETRFLWSL